MVIRIFGVVRCHGGITTDYIFEASSLLLALQLSRRSCSQSAIPFDTGRGGEIVSVLGNRALRGNRAGPCHLI